MRQNKSQTKTSNLQTYQDDLRLQKGFNVLEENNLLISIITVVFNNSKTIERTIQSVLNQSYKNVEYIIIDGGSTDGTIDVIRTYQDRINCWVSEPDKGIYDAMNKGISFATGDWIIFLGSDDMFTNNNTIESVLFKSTCLSEINISDLSVIFGDVVYTNGKRFNSNMSSLMKAWNSVHHQSAFYHKRLFDNFRYNISWGISSDYELNLKIFKDKLKWMKVDEIICVCGDSGLSSACFWRGYIENIYIRHKYLSTLESIPYDAIIIVKFTLKKMLVFSNTYFKNQSKSI